ncbi:bacteriohemerythrin [Oceanobacter mangrovi]|uniref:bacteriohemerythrin n=1 Tax=Oceanobacter mangrovi TaxID=2862510 RepID=UPI001C8E1DFE|nr:hemerythrin domain-containing protein [Oceanobacter mangrovi]
MTSTTVVVPQPLTDVIALGHADIDGDHAEFSRLIEAIRNADNAGFKELFLELTEHTLAHFELENRLMEAAGYPALGEHRGNHNRVAGELTQMAERASKGRVMFCRAYALEQLPEWFNLHIRTMDAAMVKWLEQHS